MRKLGSFVAAVLLLVAVAVLATIAGSRRDEAWPAIAEARSEPVKLTFMFWGNRAQADMYEALFAEFHRRHPQISVTAVSVPFSEYQQQISILAAGRELPDIAWAADRMVPQFMANGILEEITDVTKPADFRLDDFIPSTLDLFRKDGKIYGLPFSVPPSVIFYNADLFAQAGLPTPTEMYLNGDWTWETFREAARSITSAGGRNRVYGASFFRDWPTWIQLSTYAWSHGSGPFNRAMTSFDWDDRYGVETMEMLLDMSVTEKSHPPLGEPIDFLTGRVGMYFDVYSYVSVARQIDSFGWNIAPLPAGSVGQVPMLGQAGYVLFRDSRYPELARELLAFLAGSEGIAATSAYFVPPRLSVLNAPVFLQQEGRPSPEDIRLAVIDQMPKARFQPGHVQWQQIDKLISEGIDRLLSRELTPEQTVRWMADSVNPILDPDRGSGQR